MKRAPNLKLYKTYKIVSEVSMPEFVIFLTAEALTEINTDESYDGFFSSGDETKGIIWICPYEAYGTSFTLDQLSILPREKIKEL